MGSEGPMADGCKVLYFGLPLGALLLLEDGIDLRVACISRPEMVGMRRLRRAMAKRGGLLLVKPDLSEPTIHEVLGSVKAELIVSWFWTKKIPAEVLALAPNAFGVHPSLLPRHRGPDPYFWTLYSGDAEAGVTAHRLTPEYDTGAIIAQRALPVEPEWDAWRLARVLDRPSLELLRETALRYAHGESVGAAPQENELATDAPPPDDEACELRWDEPVARVLARIRAAAPEPGAFTGFHDHTVVILKARPATNAPAVLEPGDIVSTDEGPVICAADGAIVVLEARLDAEERVRRSAEDLSALFPGVPRL